jgi:tetratricopeptide (TPR) repeat protein
MKVRSRRTEIGLLAAAIALAAAPLAAQLQRRGPAERILVLPLTVAQAADSTFSVEFTDLVRERLASVARFRIAVIPKAQISEALQASGFPPNAILDLSTAQQLARFLSANALSVGEVSHENGARHVEFRLLDVNRSGASGTVGLPVPLSAELKKVAEDAADSIDVILKSAMDVRECELKRVQGKFSDAVKKAGDALKKYPRNGSAYLCLAMVYEAQRQPDSILYALESAVEMDPSNASAWDRLARLYQQSGDTLKSAHAFRSRLEFRPTDQALRIGVAALYSNVGLTDSAVSVLDHGLIYNPTDLAVLEVKERICTEAGRWGCILETLGQVASIDTSRLDTTFFAKVIGAAQQSDDTLQQARWAVLATQRYPDKAQYWKAQGDAFQKLGKADSALMAFEAAHRLDPTDVNAALAVANALIDDEQVDSVTWDKLVMASERGTEGERRLTALLMVKFGSVMVQRADWDGAIETLERALGVDPETQVRATATFQLGIAYFQKLNAGYTAASESKEFSCDDAAEWSGWLTRGKDYLIEGASVNPNLADQFAGYYQQYEGLIPQVREILKCS